MTSTIITVTITFVVTSLLSYILATAKKYKNSDDTQKEALKCLLRSNITSKYYVYSKLNEIPRYEKENCNYMFEQYKDMGGNSYVEELMSEMNKLPVK